MRSLVALFSLVALARAWVVPSFNPKSTLARNSIRMQSPGESESVARSAPEVLQCDVSKIANMALGLSTASIISSLASPLVAQAKEKAIWTKVDLGIKDTLFDISFDPKNADHGWLVGAKGTFLETFDGGNTWNTRSFSNLDEDEEISYRFEIANLNNNEGWIVGKPSILLHTRDGGKQFERIPLPPKLPGDPVFILSTGSNEAEMMTSQGAIYKTVNGGLNWKAQVKETIDATLNRVSSSGTSGASYFNGKVSNQIRDKNGNYLAITSRGNLFLTWSPGQDYWIPHNRGSSRRIQNMGFIENDAKEGLWMSLNGGTVLKTGSNPDISSVEIESLFKECKLNSGGYGIIDINWKNDKDVWAVGGSGIIFESKDGGNNYKFVDDAKDIPGNLYRIKFFGENKGFVLGSDGVLLKYNA